jgi:NAD(P)H-dependent FMN reductase
MTTPKILAFAGSLREASWNKKLVRIAADGAREAGADVTLIDLRDHALPIFDEDLETRDGLPPNGRKLKDLFLANQGLLLSCPEYNSSITGVLKNAIDWISRPAKGEKDLACFEGRVCGLMATSPGWRGGLRGLVTVRSILGNIGCIVLPDQVTVPTAHLAFDDAGALKDAKMAAAVRKLGATVAHTVAKLSAS